MSMRVREAGPLFWPKEKAAKQKQKSRKQKQGSAKELLPRRAERGEFFYAACVYMDLLLLYPAGQRVCHATRGENKVFTSGKSLLYDSLTIYLRKIKDAFYNDQNISTTGSI